MRHLLGAAGLLLAVAVPAAAQDVCSQYRAAPAVGSWAEYRSDRDGQQFTSRLALVGQEKRNGKDALWFETSSDSPRGRMISEILVPGYPYEPGSVMEVVVKRGDQPARKMSPEMMAMMRGGGQGGQASAPPAGGQGRGMGRGMGGRAMSNWAQRCQEYTVVGKESVKVPAGTFETTHLRNPADSMDVWVSREVPFGLVKSQGRGATMELTGHGRDAKKSITETPQEGSGM